MKVLGGRSGNDIASTLVQFLRKILASNKNVIELVLWSDSCIPPKNSLMPLALLDFLNNCENHNLIRTEQKFQEPGHNCVQEVDAIHSNIDKKFERDEIH